MATSSTLKIKLLKDTGTSTSDLITANGQTTISGYKPADLLSCRWSSDGGLTWSAWASTGATLAPPATDGNWTVQVQETTTAGKLVAMASLAFVLDTKAVAPVVQLTQDTGWLADDHVTRVGSLSVTGVETGAKVQYSVNGGTTWGTSFKAVAGANSVLVRQTDKAGNVSAATKFDFILDTTSAAAPSVKLANDTGTLGDALTRDGSLNIGLEAGARAQFSTDGGVTWLDALTPAEGLNKIQVRQVDLAGNTSAGTAFSFTLDTTAAKPVLALLSDTGTAGDHITANAAINATGLETGATLAWSTDGGATWGASFTAVEGAHTVLARQTDRAGNVSDAASLSYVLDTQGPVATGDSASTTVDTPVTVDVLGNDTDATALTLTGASAGAHGSVAVQANGTLSYTPDAGWTGTDSFSYTVADAAGNVSSAQVLVDVTGVAPPPPPPGGNTAPQVFGPLALWTPLDQPTSVYALQNAWDAENDALLVTALPTTLPAGVSFDATTQTFTFDPTTMPAGGSVTVTYSITDGLASVATSVTFASGTSPFVALDPAAVPATALTDALIHAGAGIVVDAASLAWHASGPSAVNLYDGSLGALGIGAGLLITSGTTPTPMNTSTGFGSDNNDWIAHPDGLNGDADLDTVVNTVFATQSYDATTLEFDFDVSDPTATSISFDLVFGSDEYPEWVDAFVDVAVVLVNGQNVALFDHNPLAPLSVIGSNLAASYFTDNTDAHLPIEYDGVSARLKIIAPVVAGTNHIKIGIGDTGDHILDSGIFLANFAAGNLPGGGGVLIDQSGTSGSDGDDLIDLSARTVGCVAEGLRGDDILIGGSGDDTLIGGLGKDLLRGNGGSDVFDYRHAEDWADQDRDTIDDFSGNTAALANAASLDALNGDVLLVNWNLLASQPDFVGTGFSAPTAGRYATLTAAWLSSHTDGTADAAHAQFVYDAATGLVSFDADGTGSASAVALTLIGNAPSALSLTDIVIVG
jgi:hypothetical protein